MEDYLRINTHIPLFVKHVDSMVYRIAYSPNGNNIMALCINLNNGKNYVSVWENGIEERILLHHNEGRRLFWANDGKHLIMKYTKPFEHLMIYNMETKQEIETSFGVAGVAMSPDGSKLAVNMESTGVVEVYDATSGWILEKQTPKELWPHSDVVTDIAFSPDNTTVATTDDEGTFKIWNLDTTRVIHETTRAHYTNITYSPNGKYIAVGIANNVVLFDSTFKKRRRRGTRKSIWERIFVEGYMNLSTVTAIDFSPDGSVLAASGIINHSPDRRTGIVKIHRVDDGGCLRKMFVEQVVWCVKFSPDGCTLAMGSGSYKKMKGSLQLWTTPAYESNVETALEVIEETTNVNENLRRIIKTYLI